MSGGETNPANTIAYTIGDVVDYAGLIVAIGGTADYMLLAAASSDEPLGYTYTAKKNPVTGASLAKGQRVGIHALIEGQKAEFKLPASHAAISYGDEIMSTTAGCVVKKTAGVGWVLGRATEAKTLNEGGYVEVRISKRYVYAS